LAIFRTFSLLLEAVKRLTEAVHALARVQGSAAPAIERLDALELSRHQFEAELQGALLEAKGKLKASLNAEARERQLKKSYETNLDIGDEAGEAGPGVVPILPVNAPPSETERLSSLHLGLAPDDKAAALAHKFGR